ncbi:hypothetical protein F442_02720 [Phytophthora nicotianae P10297]|uniref:RxLR effector protein n=4 Tax=Phytophthora nicotianae TaxID=4792 RepID=W2QJK0_PHYN3|nr:hypothetical protein PPTG_08176 [Phytophthora nicotianae INRA-310]ETL99240.1 hypothetical protein L917_03877 [Phytophthora nicotianae]ETN13298.1 hypothetical protein PPTG_08176 [Phytophthora nicotianae INRA-310]ETP52229.1 hypothetical protein F442_02720 [Phytophthora nicotianae P10297]
MKRLFMFVVLLAGIIATGVALGEPEYGNNKLSDTSHQRYLRVTGTTYNDAAAEERRLQSSLYGVLGKAATKLPLPEKLKFVIWRKAGWDYNILKQKLFKGVPKEVYEKDPRFEKVLLKFGAYMRSM